MIVHTVDEGWGLDWPIKQFEKEILDQYLTPIKNDSSKTVLINSVWYTVDLHQQTLEQLRQMDFNRIVLVSTLDCSIPQPDWFAEFNCEVIGVGYYQGANYIDLWALVVDKYLELDKYVLGNASLIDTAYMCLNRKPHFHRRRLYEQLKIANLLDQGIVSLGGDDEFPAQRILALDDGVSYIAPNPGKEQHGIANDITSLGHPENWQRHFLNVVTETVWEINKLHFVSEKIFKPIVGEKPFILYDTTGGDTWFRDRGFATFYQDFGDITNLDISRDTNQTPFLQALCEQPKSYLSSKYIALQSKILYNKHRFSEYVAEQKTKIKQGIQCQI
jgi:hypothetical protein